MTALVQLDDRQPGGLREYPEAPGHVVGPVRRAVVLAEDQVVVSPGRARLHPLAELGPCPGLVTVGAIVVSLLTTKGDRARDDRKRQEDRDESARQVKALQRESEDRAARQVIVDMVTEAPQNQSPGWTGLNRKVTISAPADYVVKQLVMQMAGMAGTGMSIRPAGPQIENGAISHGQKIWSFWAEAHEQLNDPAPIISFVDNQDNLYFQYKGRTQRFPAGTEFIAAVTEIQNWLNMGPEADDSAG